MSINDSGPGRRSGIPAVGRIGRSGCVVTRWAVRALRHKAVENQVTGTLPNWMSRCFKAGSNWRGLVLSLEQRVSP